MCVPCSLALGLASLWDTVTFSFKTGFPQSLAFQPGAPGQQREGSWEGADWAAPWLLTWSALSLPLSQEGPSTCPSAGQDRILALSHLSWFGIGSCLHCSLAFLFWQEPCRLPRFLTAAWGHPHPPNLCSPLSAHQLLSSPPRSCLGHCRGLLTSFPICSHIVALPPRNSPFIFLKHLSHRAASSLESIRGSQWLSLSVHLGTIPGWSLSSVCWATSSVSPPGRT